MRFYEVAIPQAVYIGGEGMSMADYYEEQGIQAMADHDNMIDKLERDAKEKALKELIKKLIREVLLEAKQ